MTITIRRVTHIDLAQYHAVRLRGLEDHPQSFGESAEHFRAVSVEELSQRLEKASARECFTLGAYEEDGSLVGVVSLGRDEGEKSMHRGILWGMYVVPIIRNKGVGVQLVSALLANAQSISGLEQIRLSVVTTNSSALTLYKKLGFEVYGTDRAALKIDGVAFDEFLMVRQLRSL